MTKNVSFCWFCEVSKCKLFVAEKAKLLAAKQADNNSLSHDYLCGYGSNLKLKVLFYTEYFIWGSNRMKRLKDFKITERISRQTIEVLPMQFGDDEATRRIMIHHARRVIRQHKEEIHKLAYK